MQAYIPDPNTHREEITYIWIDMLILSTLIRYGTGITMNFFSLATHHPSCMVSWWVLIPSGPQSQACAYREDFVGFCMMLVKHVQLSGGRKQWAITCHHDMSTIWQAMHTFDLDLILRE